MNELRDFLTNLDSVVIAMYSLYFLMLIVVSMIIYLISYYVDYEIIEEEKKDFDLNIATKALEQFEEKPREIYGGANPLENTAPIPTQTVKDISNSIISNIGG